jgi:hypothetical protein
MVVAERFLSSIVNECDGHPVSIDGGWVYGIHIQPAGF